MSFHGADFLQCNLDTNKESAGTLEFGLESWRPVCQKGIDTLGPLVEKITTQKCIDVLVTFL